MTANWHDKCSGIQIVLPLLPILLFSLHCIHLIFSVVSFSSQFPHNTCSIGPSFDSQANKQKQVYLEKLFYQAVSQKISFSSSQTPEKMIWFEWNHLNTCMRIFFIKIYYHRFQWNLGENRNCWGKLVFTTKIIMLYMINETFYVCKCRKWPFWLILYIYINHNKGSDQMNNNKIMKNYKLIQ